MKIAEQLQLEHFSREAFLRLLDHVIDRLPPRQLILAENRPGIREPIELHPTAVFDLVLSGTKHMIYAGHGSRQETRLRPGDVFYTAPLVWKRPLWDCAHEMTSFVYGEKFIRLTYVDIPRPPAPGMYPKSSCFYHTQLPPSEAIRKLLSALPLLAGPEENDDRNRAAVEIAQAVFRLTRELLRSDHAPQFSRSQLTYQRIQQYLRDNFQANINRNHVAGVFKLHPGYLSRLYRENGPQTFSETLHALRMEHAARLVRNTDLPIEEITGQCGYESPTFFTAAFKQYFGLPPGKFRQQHWQTTVGGKAGADGIFRKKFPKN